MRYKSFDPEAKVIGVAMLGFRAAADQEMIEPLLAKYGLTDIQPEKWYPLQPWLDVLSDISEQAGDYASMLTFVNIGTKVAASISIPAEMVQKVGAIEFAVSSSPDAYAGDHQGNVGSSKTERVSDKHMKLSIVTPYPPDFWYGVVYGMTRRFHPGSFVVQYEDMAMRHYSGTEMVVIHVLFE